MRGLMLSKQITQAICGLPFNKKIQSCLGNKKTRSIFFPSNEAMNFVGNVDDKTMKKV
jgi:hypothetical protein